MQVPGQTSQFLRCVVAHDRLLRLNAVQYATVWRGQAIDRGPKIDTAQHIGYVLQSTASSRRSLDRTKAWRGMLDKRN